MDGYRLTQHPASLVWCRSVLCAGGRETACTGWEWTVCQETGYAGCTEADIVDLRGSGEKNADIKRKFGRRLAPSPVGEGRGEHQNAHRSGSNHIHRRAQRHGGRWFSSAISLSTPSFIMADFFWLLMVLILRFSFLPSNLGHETFSEKTQNFALFWRQAFVTVATCTDFSSRRETLSRVNFLPFCSAAGALGRSVGAPCFQYNPFDIQIQHGAQNRRVVIHGQNNDRDVREVTFNIFDEA